MGGQAAQLLAASQHACPAADLKPAAPVLSRSSHRVRLVSACHKLACPANSKPPEATMLRSLSEIRTHTQQQASQPQRDLTLPSGLLKAACDPSSRHLFQIEQGHRKETGTMCLAQLLHPVHHLHVGISAGSCITPCCSCGCSPSSRVVATKDSPALSPGQHDSCPIGVALLMEGFCRPPMLLCIVGQPQRQLLQARPCQQGSKQRHLSIIALHRAGKLVQDCRVLLPQRWPLQPLHASCRGK